MDIKDVDRVLDFWFNPQNQSKWFASDAAFDKEIITNFATLHQHAAEGQLTLWEGRPRLMLALIIILDQFSRNIYRNRPESFACDTMTLSFTHDALEQDFDQEFDMPERRFFYMPLMHSESLDQQKQCVSLLEMAGDTNSLPFAIQHKDIIERFGRFPHRNRILGRESTKDELDFLKNEHSGF